MSLISPKTFQKDVIECLRSNDRDYIYSFEDGVKDLYTNVNQEFIIENYRILVKNREIRLKGTLMGVVDKDYKIENFELVD